MRKASKTIRNFILFFFFLFLGVILGTLIIYTHAQNSSFWIKYIDVGQGDAALIQCDGHYMMIDGGPPAASSTIYTILKNDGISTIDYMIATHPDADHIGGLSGALNYATVKKCYSPVTSHDTKPFQSLKKYLQKQNTAITVPKYGDRFLLGKATVDMVGPAGNAESNNDQSIVVRIQYGSTSFLFTGDAEEEEELSMMGAGANLSCDVLKVSHHGSADATTTGFLTKCKPSYAVISVGKDNAYGHPTVETLKRLKEANIKGLYRTDLQGDIVCVSDGKKISFTTEKQTTEESLWLDGAAKTDSGIYPERSMPVSMDYVVNKNSKKFHYPDCSSVLEMKQKNRMDVTGTREELIEAGYSPCGRCKP